MDSGYKKIPINRFLEYVGSDFKRWHELKGAIAHNKKLGPIKIDGVRPDHQYGTALYADGRVYPLSHFNPFYFSELEVSDALYTAIVSEKEYKAFREKILTLLSNNDYCGASECLQSQSGNIETAIFEAEKQNWINKKNDSIVDLLKKGNQWEEAIYLFDCIKPYIEESQRQAFCQKYTTFLCEYIEPHLQRNKFDFVRGIINVTRPITLDGSLDELVAKYQNQYELEQQKKKYFKKIGDVLSEYHFEEADFVFNQNNFVSEKEYYSLKAAYLPSFFHEKYGLSLNSEQAISIALNTPSLLIKARAGSGKTRVLACKAALLVDRYHVNPDHILILAFNRKAADEIGMRIRREYKLDSYENARTFHGLAYQITPPGGKLLFNDNGEFSRPALSNFVQEILRELWNSDIQARLYEIFRKEMRSFLQAGALLNDADYIAYIRNRRDITLNGDRVKSNGEKYIADFLFEHDIPYIYERIEFWSGHAYRPDFTLFLETGQFVIEFWGIDENDPKRIIPKAWGITWERYRDQMIEKRRYWQEQGIPLIELSIVDTRGGREQFEEILKSRLQQLDKPCKKLPQKDLEKKVIRNQKDRMTELFVQFIQKAKKRAWNASEMQEQVRQYATGDERVRIFINLACQVYEAYENKLKTQNMVDFDELLVQSAAKIDETKGECSISIGPRKERKVRMKDLKYIMIDEYQDFSQLFFNLVAAIMRHNPQLGILCVGDDWQAINSFAGSDLRFYHQFQEFLDKGETTTLLTNHRSEKAIIEYGNALMSGMGEPGIPLLERNGGEVNIQTIDDIWVECREDQEFANEYEQDKRFLFYEERENGRRMNDNGFLQARYLKVCYQIITDPENWKLITQTGKDQNRPRVAILSRTNQVYRVTLKEFGDKLKTCFAPDELRQIGDFNHRIRLSTAHGFKGLEADIVIVLRVCEGSFPLIHPDNSLYTIFGQNEQHVLDEERRLFYVAITRAVSKLYLLTEEGNESPFLNSLPAHQSMVERYRREINTNIFKDEIPF